MSTSIEPHSYIEHNRKSTTGTTGLSSYDTIYFGRFILALTRDGDLIVESRNVDGFKGSISISPGDSDKVFLSVAKWGKA